MVEKVAIYTRAPSEEQNQTQQAQCIKYAEMNDWSVAGTFSDVGQSGIDSDRPGLNQLLQFLQQREDIKGVVVKDISRLSRDVQLFLKIVDVLNGKKIFTASGGMYNLKSRLRNDT